MRRAVRGDGAKGFDNASTTAFRFSAPHALGDCLVVGHARRRYAPVSENDPRRLSTLGQSRRTGTKSTNRLIPERDEAPTEAGACRLRPRGA
jgi:hypothetical protein